MADIFDTLEKPKTDIFDEVAPEPVYGEPGGETITAKEAADIEATPIPSPGRSGFFSELGKGLIDMPRATAGGAFLATHSDETLKTHLLDQYNRLYQEPTPTAAGKVGRFIGGTAGSIGEGIVAGATTGPVGLMGAFASAGAYDAFVKAGTRALAEGYTIDESVSIAKKAALVNAPVQAAVTRLLPTRGAVNFPEALRQGVRSGAAGAGGALVENLTEKALGLKTPLLEGVPQAGLTMGGIPLVAHGLSRVRFPQLPISEKALDDLAGEPIPFPAETEAPLPPKAGEVSAAPEIPAFPVDAAEHGIKVTPEQWDRMQDWQRDNILQEIAARKQAKAEREGAQTARQAEKGEASGAPPVEETPAATIPTTPQAIQPSADSTANLQKELEASGSVEPGFTEPTPIETTPKTVEAAPVASTEPTLLDKPASWWTKDNVATLPMEQRQAIARNFGIKNVRPEAIAKKAQERLAAKQPTKGEPSEKEKGQETQGLLTDPTAAEPTTGQPPPASSALDSTYRAGKSFNEVLNTEPWALSQFQYADVATPQATYTKPKSPKWRAAIAEHRRIVEQALREGKPVPPEVLADYPDLAKPAQAKAQTELPGASPDTQRQVSVHIQSDKAGDRPMGIVPPATASLFESLRALSGQLAEPLKLKVRQFAMESLPKITAANREVGEAGVRYGASFQVAREKGLVFAGNVLQGLKVDPVQFGTALAEDNLRGIKQANPQADVTSLIGKANSPFRTEQAYQDFLARPDVQLAIRRHKQLWAEQKDPLFREATDLDPETELPSRGLQTDARINLKSIMPGDTVSRPIGASAPIIRQLATLRRFDPFAQRAKGTGLVYEGNYNEIMAHGFEKEMPVAKQHEFIRKLIESGDAAVTDTMKSDVKLKDEPTHGFLLRLNPWKGKALQVRRSLANEYKEVSGLSESARIPYFTKAAEFFTRQSIRGLAEGTAHTSNLLMQVFTGPGPTSTPLLNALIKAVPGRLDLLYSIPRVIIRGLKANRDEMVKLAEIGAAKEPYKGAISSRIINPIDRGVRLVSSDIYKGLAEKGLVENTETGLREFVNQVGNYNKRLQPKLIRVLRESGVQPFATAIHTFNVMGGRRTFAMSSGAKAASVGADAMLRADVLAGWVGFIGTAVALNLIISGKATGPQGTHLGAVGWQGDDGKLHELDIGRLTGYTRGLRATGVYAALQARMDGLPPNEAIRAGTEQAANTALSYVTGPAVRFGFVAATGKSPSIPAYQKSKVAPPGDESLNPLKSQLANNIVEAAKEANPIIGTAMDIKDGKPLGEVLSRQAFRYVPQTVSGARSSDRFPEIVNAANIHKYADFWAREARKLPMEKRADFLFNQYDKDNLTGPNRDKVISEVNKKGVFKYD